MNAVLTYAWWLIETSAPPLALVMFLGFVFREKWKQILARSLHADLERQRHEFSRDLEAYKTVLIAQVESIKLKNDVQKSITNKYAEKKFDCLLILEQELSSTGMFVCNLLNHPAALRRPEQLQQALTAMETFSKARAKAEMFLEIAERQTVISLAVMCSELLSEIGPGHEPLGVDTPKGRALLSLQMDAENMIRDKLHKLAAI